MYISHRVGINVFSFFDIFSSFSSQNRMYVRRRINCRLQKPRKFRKYCDFLPEEKKFDINILHGNVHIFIWYFKICHFFIFLPKFFQILSITITITWLLYYILLLREENPDPFLRYYCSHSCTTIEYGDLYQATKIILKNVTQPWKNDKQTKSNFSVSYIMS